MIRFKNDQGEFEFDDVADLRKFLRPNDVTDFDMRQFGYLVSNVCGHKYSALSIYCNQGLNALVDLRIRGMDKVVTELKPKE